MATVAEILKSAGVADDVAAGLPKEVLAAFNGITADADTKLSTAAQESRKAEEARRQAKLERDDMQKYVEEYGQTLNQQGSLQAKYDATVAYVKSLKDQGFDVELPAEIAVDAGGSDKGGRRAAVPGSPAVGGNAVDEGKIYKTVGNWVSQFQDANNEHMRIYGSPLPEATADLAAEAERARKPIGQFIAEKYKFAEKRKEKEKFDYDARVKADAAVIVAEERRKDAEKNGSNPNLRNGESSRASIVPKINPTEFHKGDGNVPVRERHRRMLENLHKDVEQIRSVA
jgi:hypothetical protein